MVTGTVEHGVTQQRLERRTVQAVLTEGAASTTSVQAVDDGVWATVHWTASDGSPHAGQTKMASSTVKASR
jgi:hypothetical protein